MTFPRDAFLEKKIDDFSTWRVTAFPPIVICIQVHMQAIAKTELARYLPKPWRLHDKERKMTLLR